MEETPGTTIEIISLWPGNKAGLIIEHKPDIKRLRLAIVPRANTGPAVHIFLDLPTARVLFLSLTTGQLTGPATRANKERNPDKGFTHYTKTPQVQRHMILENKPDGIAIHIHTKQNGQDKQHNSLYFTDFQTQILAHEITHYLNNL